MPNASGLLALGQALDDYLVGEYSPPPGTQTALGFLPGIAVNPSSFAPTGVVNPLAVNTFLNSVLNVLGPVVDGRFAGFLSAHQIYGTVLDVAFPVDPLGTPAADAFLSVKNTARSAFGASPVKQLVAVPMNWYDPASSEGWASFSTSASGAAGSAESSSEGETSPKPSPKPMPGETPPIIAPERFEKLWQWRTLDDGARAQVVLPAPEAATVTTSEDPPVVVRDHRTKVNGPIVRDHRGIDLSDVSVRDHRSVSRSFSSQAVADFKLAPSRQVMLQAVAAAPTVAEAQVQPVLATAPRRQLIAALADDQPMFAAGDDVTVKSQAVAQLIETQAPVLVAEIDDDAETSSTQTVESHDLTLSLEYCFVQVSRDAWWNDAVLRMPRWYAPGCKAGAFSSGTTVGGLPLGLPIAMVITRNVQVSGRWSEADRAAAESHTSFGPWSTHESTMEYDESNQSATLAIPGWQVVAVVCALLPPLAPADDPSLAAGEPAAATA